MAKRLLISKAISKPGALSRQLEIPLNKNIPINLLEKINKSDIGTTIINPASVGKRRIKVTLLLKRRANLALILKRLRK